MGAYRNANLTQAQSLEGQHVLSMNERLGSKLRKRREKERNGKGREGRRECWLHDTIMMCILTKLQVTPCTVKTEKPWSAWQPVLRKREKDIKTSRRYIWWPVISWMAPNWKIILTFWISDVSINGNGPINAAEQKTHKWGAKVRCLLWEACLAQETRSFSRQNGNDRAEAFEKQTVSSIGLWFSFLETWLN